MSHYRIIALAILLPLSLTACLETSSTQTSEESGTTTTDPGISASDAVTSAEIETLASASIETTKAVLLKDDATPFIPSAESLFSEGNDPLMVLSQSAESVNVDLTFAPNISVSDDFSGPCGGSVTASYAMENAGDSIESRPLTAELDLNMSEFCGWFFEEENTITVSGSLNLLLHIAEDNSGFIDLAYNLDIASDIPGFVYQGNQTYEEYCTYSVEDQIVECSQASIHVTANDEEFSMSDVVTQGNKSNGFRGLGIISSQTSESVYDVTFRDVLLCENGNLQSGRLTLENVETREDINIEVTNCNEAVVSWNGEAMVVTQQTPTP